MLPVIVALATIGFSISVYTYILEQQMKNTPNYKAVCDISDRFSCSKPILSQYNNILFVSNAIIGMLYYAGLMVLSYLNATHLILIAAIGAFCVSLALAYILYAKIKTFCILCVSLHITNLAILITSIYNIAA